MKIWRMFYLFQFLITFATNSKYNLKIKQERYLFLIPKWIVYCESRSLYRDFEFDYCQIPRRVIGRGWLADLTHLLILTLKYQALLPIIIQSLRQTPKTVTKTTLVGFEHAV